MARQIDGNIYRGKDIYVEGKIDTRKNIYMEKQIYGKIDRWKYKKRGI